MRGKARILVTLMVGQQHHSYVWVLSQQNAAPYENCWMTDAVIPLHRPDSKTEADNTI